MNIAKSFFSLLVVIGWMAQATAHANVPISWRTSRAQAVAAAQASGKLILLVAGRDSCPNTQFMKTDMCNRLSIRQVIDAHYICWYSIVDTATDYYPYATGLGSYTLPLICVIDPDDVDHYLDRTTNRQSDEAVFRARLLSHVSGADAFEPDNAASAAKAIGNTQLQNRSIHATGDVDFAKFVIGGIGAKNVCIETAGPVGGDTQLWVYKGSSGALMGYDDDSGTGTFSRLMIAALTPGTYFAKVTEYNNNGTIDAYTLRANWATQYANGDAYEPDDAASAAKAIANGQTQIRAIHAAGNVDWAKFVVGGGGAMNVVVETAGAAGDTQVWVFKGSNGAQMGYDDNSGAGNFSRISIMSLNPGTYFIKIQENGNNATVPAYTLRATWATLLQ